MSPLTTLEYRVDQIEKDLAALEGKLDGLRRILMGLIITIATSSLMLLLALVLTAPGRQ